MTETTRSFLMTRRLAAGMLAAALAGCTSMAPPTQTPELPVPDAWPRGTQASDGTQASALSWHEYFTDPVLQQLIRTALDNNRDLRIAALRVEEARAAFQIQRSDQFPTVGLSGQSARARVPGDLNPAGQAVVGGEHRAEVGVMSWELDLWGRVRSLHDAALEQWLATEEGRRAVELSLITQVAEGYLGVRELDERIALARRTVDSREESLRIFNRRHALGATSRLDLQQVEILLTQAQSLLAQLEQARATQVYALGLLLGAHPGPLPESVPFDEATVLAPLSPGLPSDLLTARPDIIAAEHRLRASNANIGAARAAFFPRIALTGSFGSASAELDGLFASGSRAWTFMPTLSLPIFDGGQRRANLDLAEVRSHIAVAEYERSVQTAFREVSDALSAYRWLAQQRDVQRTALSATAERARLVQLRYEHGSAAYFEVLDALRDLLVAEQQMVQTRRALLSSQVALYAALGGGTSATTH